MYLPKYVHMYELQYVCIKILCTESSSQFSLYSSDCFHSIEFPLIAVHHTERMHKFDAVLEPISDSKTEHQAQTYDAEYEPISTSQAECQKHDDKYDALFEPLDLPTIGKKVDNFDGDFFNFFNINSCVEILEKDEILSANSQSPFD